MKNPFKAIKTKWRTLIRNAATKSLSINDPEFLEALGLGGAVKCAENEVTYFTCLKMLSETLAKMPIKLFQATEHGVERIENSDLDYVLNVRPNPLMTPTIFWNTVEMNRNHFGNAYVYIRRILQKKKYGGEYKILDLWIMQSNCVSILVDDAGYFAGKGRIWYRYGDPISGQQYIFGSDEVMHFKTSFTFDGITGKPVQKILTETIRGASASQTYLNTVYTTGMTAKAVLEYTGDLKDDAVKKLREAFETLGSGQENSGRMLPVPLGFKVTPLDIKLTDAQFFELKKYTALQIAGAFGIKPNQINDYDKSSYSNSEMQQLSFYVDTELFIIKQYEEEILFKLLSREQIGERIYTKFNEKVLLRTDTKTQMETLAAAVSGSIYMSNEARRKLDMPDAEGGDCLIANGNVIPLTDAGKQYEKQSGNTENNKDTEKGEEVKKENEDSEPNNEEDNLLQKPEK